MPVYLTEEQLDDSIFATDGDEVAPGIEKVTLQYTDTGRWTVNHILVVKALTNGTLWGFHYQQPATEYQEGQECFDSNTVEPEGDLYVGFEVVPEYVTRYKKAQ